MKKEQTWRKAFFFFFLKLVNFAQYVTFKETFCFLIGGNLLLQQVIFLMSRCIQTTQVSGFVFSVCNN